MLLNVPNGRLDFVLFTTRPQLVDSPRESQLRFFDAITAARCRSLTSKRNVGPK